MPHRMHAWTEVLRRAARRPGPLLALIIGLAGAWPAAPCARAAEGEFIEQFTGSGRTGQALYLPSAVTLGDGRVLMIGGSALAPQGGSNVSVASCELYDPASGTWSPTGTLLTARRGCGACLLADGQVMVAGGYDVVGGATIVLSAAELFAPATGRWSPLPAMPGGLTGASLMVLPSGEVLALGTGTAGLSAGAIYSVATGRWRAIAPNLVPRAACAYALLPSGLALAAGGTTLSGGPGSSTAIPTTSCELYDPVADAWSPTGALLSSHLSCACVVLPSGAVLIGAGSGAAGGTGGTTPADSELYANGSWTATGQLPYPVIGAAVCLLSSGDALSAGGSSGRWITSAARYDRATGSWSPAFAMADSHYLGALAALAGDQAVIIDGWDEIVGADGSVSFASDGGSEVYQQVVINTAPSFIPGPDQTVFEDSGAHTVAGWATAISPGLPAESAQTVSFLVGTTDPGLFSVPPAVDGAGTLTYTLAADVLGSATVTVQAHDDGGTAHGGQDTSAAQSFIITVQQVQAPAALTLTLHSVLGVAVSGQLVLSDPDHQLPPDPPSFALTGISQLGALTVTVSGLATFSPTQPGSQQVAYTASVAGVVYQGSIMLYDNAWVASRPLISSTPIREQGASGAPWSYALIVDPLSIAAGDVLAVTARSGDGALNAAAITPTSGSQFAISVPALDAGGGPLQTVTLIVTDLSTNLSDAQQLILVILPPGGAT